MPESFGKSQPILSENPSEALGLVELSPEDRQNLFDFLQRTHQARVALGRGRCADVYTSDRIPFFRGDLCVKAIRKTAATINAPEDEFNVHEQVYIAGIRTPRPLCLITDSLAGTDRPNAFILMERIHGVTLREYLVEQGGFTADEAVVFKKQIEKLILAMRESDIYHRDLHLNNIMIDTKTRELYLIDWGNGKRIYFSEEHDTVLQHTKKEIIGGRIKETRKFFIDDREILKEIDIYTKK